MNIYDVIVVGAGPAGCAAAKAAAEKGAKTIILEEHRAVGVPQHCPGRMQGSSFTESILKSIDQRLILTEYHTRRIYTPKGNIVQEKPIAGRGCCLVERADFDREIARLAVKSGSALVMNTRVTGLLKVKDKIEGVLTSSSFLPQVLGKVVISAEGIGAWTSGIPRQEFPGNEEFRSGAGILFELMGVKDIDPAIPEIHIGSFNEERYCTLWPRDQSSCIMSISSMDTFYKIKEGNYPISRKIRDAHPVQMNGWSLTSARKSLPTGVQDGLILAGNARGYTGIIHAIVSGQFAGQVASEAVKEGNTSEEKLKKYDFLCRKVGLHLTGRDGAALAKLRSLSDEAIEALLPEMARNNELDYLDQLPF